MLTAKWETYTNSVETYELLPPLFVPNTVDAGIVLNSFFFFSHSGDDMVQSFLKIYESGRVFVTSVKSTFPMGMVGVLKAMIKLETACAPATHGKFVPGFKRDHDEWTNRLHRFGMERKVCVGRT